MTRRSVATLAAKTGALNVNAELVAGLVPETAKVTVNVSRGAEMDVPGLLLALDRYPYGCAEQTVSRALPLLYYNELAEASGLAGENGARGRIEKAIQRIVSLQDSSGNFGLWSAGGRDLWLTAYVSDFLTRAKEKGYHVPPVVLATALDRLKNSVSTAQEFELGRRGTGLCAVCAGAGGQGGDRRFALLRRRAH